MKKTTYFFIAAVLTILLCSYSTYSQKNVVLPSNGGLLESFTSEWGAGYEASNLTNGVTNEDGWASTANPAVPQEFIYSFSGGQEAILSNAVMMCL